MPRVRGLELHILVKQRQIISNCGLVAFGLCWMAIKPPMELLKSIAIAAVGLDC